MKRNAFIMFCGMIAASVGASPGASQKSSADEAPRQGAASQGNWASGVKEFFGTAFESYDSQLKYSASSKTAPLSKVWFTGSDGLLSEVYWPILDMPQTRDTEILVSDGKSFLWGERGQPTRKVEWIEKGVPAFRVIHKDQNDRFEFEKIIFSHPDTQSVVMKVRVQAKVEGLKFYLLHKPSVQNTPLGDYAEIRTTKSKTAFVAWEGNYAQALLTSLPIAKASVSFVGPQDGFSDLARDFEMNDGFRRAYDGNVMGLMELKTNSNVGTVEFEVILSFASTPEGAMVEAEDVLMEDSSDLLKKFSSQWFEYQGNVLDLEDQSFERKDLFRNSVALLKSMEDKTFEGAYVASPVIPWGTHRRDWADAAKDARTQLTGGYHLVWPRDLYKMATSFLALGDTKSAVAALNRLRAMQFGPQSGTWNYGPKSFSRNGSFPQNSWVDGTPYWDNLQLDEVAMPVVLAYELWKNQSIDLKVYWDMIHRAADFVERVGPWSAQERWEEHFGLSPSTMAAAISALTKAAVMARVMGDNLRAQKYEQTANQWDENLEKWTFTSSGAWGNGAYFVRLEGAHDWEQVWDPNDDLSYQGANGAAEKKEKNVVDGGFLELVRFGVRRANSKSILESLPEYDQALRVNIPGFGAGFHRYTGDRYNIDEETGLGTEGMLWPLLTAERGYFEIQRARENGASCAQIRVVAEPFVVAVERFATATSMLPEQVWSSGARAGRPTGAATPLGWAHGEYIKLLRSLRDCN